jgi:hypothetical protein
MKRGEMRGLFLQSDRAVKEAGGRVLFDDDHFALAAARPLMRTLANDVRNDRDAASRRLTLVSAGSWARTF